MFSRMERVRIKEDTCKIHDPQFYTCARRAWTYLELLEHDGLLQLVFPAPWAADAHWPASCLQLMARQGAKCSDCCEVCSVWERMRKGEVWSAREGSQRMEVVMVVMRMDGGSCGHQLSSLVITAGCSTALAAPASLSARRPVRVNTCSVELCDLWFTVHITELYLTKHW